MADDINLDQVPDEIPDDISAHLVLIHLIGETQRLINTNKGILSMLSLSKIEDDIRSAAIHYLTGATERVETEIKKIRVYLDRSEDRSR